MGRILFILFACLAIFLIMVLASKLIEKPKPKSKEDFMSDIEEVSKRVKDLK